MKLSRRGLLKEGGFFLLGATVGGLSLSQPGDLARATAVKQETMEVPWPYKKLNAEVVAEKAYDGYYKGACCYGVFESIIGELRAEIGAPYTMVPTSMMIYGEGGIAGVASVCGALNGAAAAIFLITGKMDKKEREIAFSLTRELFNWYEQVSLPDYRPPKPKYEIVKSISRSTLCHASVSNWCKTAKVKAFSKERSERCGWLTSSVAKRTVELLNTNAEGNFKGIHKLSKEVQSCMSCHEKGGIVENIRGMTDCGGCHFRGPSQHSKT